MAIEIERRFLVVGATWRKGVLQSIPLRQGFLSTVKERVVRVRIEGDQATLTIKGLTVGLRKPEFEYPIPVADAMFLLDQLCPQPLIEKIRHYRTFAGQPWVIDEFQGQNQGLILAEAELTDPDQPLELPDWIGQEVSGDARYFNASLAVSPYNSWSASAMNREDAVLLI